MHRLEAVFGGKQGVQTGAEFGEDGVPLGVGQRGGDGGTGEVQLHLNARYGLIGFVQRGDAQNRPGRRNKSRGCQRAQQR